MPLKPKVHRPNRLKAAGYQRPAQDRPTACKRGYDRKWRKARAAWLMGRHCVDCEKEGKITPATVIDHVTPHRGSYELFWDEDNWAAVCTYHHNQRTVQYDGGLGRPVRPKGE